MHPASVIALGQSHQQEIRRAAAHAQAIRETSSPRRPLHTRLHPAIGTLSLATLRRRPVLGTVPATKRA